MKIFEGRFTKHGMMEHQ
jgi:hypothetical protein